LPAGLILLALKFDLLLLMPGFAEKPHADAPQVDEPYAGSVCPIILTAYPVSWFFSLSTDGSPRRASANPTKADSMAG
jgi:hypothetical protein